MGQEGSNHSFSVGGRTWPRRRRGTEGRLRGPWTQMCSHQDHRLQLADQGWRPAWLLTTALGKVPSSGQRAHGVGKERNLKSAIVDGATPPGPSLPISELQATAAELLGVERTLFVPTNTMANLISGEHGATSICPPGPPSMLLPFVLGAVTTSVGLRAIWNL